MNFSKLSPHRHVKIIEIIRVSNYDSINLLFYYYLMDNTHGQCHLCKQLTPPSQPPTFTVIQLSRCDNYMLMTGVYKRPDFERWRVKNMKCVLRDLGHGSRDREL